MGRRSRSSDFRFRGGEVEARRGTRRDRLSVFGFSVFGFGGAAVKQDVVLVISEDVDVRRELADRLDWDDIPFELASTPAEALETIAQVPSGARCVVVLDFDRRARARVMDALRGREDLEIRLLLLHDAFEDGLSDARVVEHVRRPAVPDYLYSLVERHATRAVA